MTNYFVLRSKALYKGIEKRQHYYFNRRGVVCNVIDAVWMTYEEARSLLYFYMRSKKLASGEERDPADYWDICPLDEIISPVSVQLDSGIQLTISLPEPGARNKLN